MGTEDVTILGIDPGKRHIAWAKIGPRGLFVGLARSNATWPRCSLDVSDAVCAGGVNVIITELPRIYPTSSLNRNRDPNDLITLSFTAGCLVYGIFNLQREAPHVMVTYPHEWKGSVPKEVTQNRVRQQLRDRKLLSTFDKMLELHPKSLQHNIYDATGIALYGLTKC